MRDASRRLFASAFIFGTVTAVYWTFAVDLLVTHGTLAQAESRLFWVLLGAFGLIGGAVGDFVTRFGLRRTFRAALLLTAFAIGSPATWPDNHIVAFSSAVVFGAAFIMATGLFGIWSVRVFHDRPSAGFGATFFLISAGQLIGPTLCGMVAGEWGLATAFHLSAILGLVAVALGPRQDFYSMAVPDADAAKPPTDGAVSSGSPSCG